MYVFVAQCKSIISMQVGLSTAEVSCTADLNIYGIVLCGDFDVEKP